MSSRSGCLKPVLFGCLGLILLIAIIVGVGAFMALNGVKNEQVADTELTPSSGEAIDPAHLAALARRSGRVELLLGQGEFIVQPGEPGAGVKVKARFDQSAHELLDTLEVLPDSTWVYRVEYRQTISGLESLLRAVFGGNQESRVEVYLPPDVPIDLVLDVKQGGGEAELGGLWLRDATITYGQGGFELAVSEPLREPMGRLVIAGSMGGFEVTRLGNASPRYLGIDCNMGGGEVDLSGQWLNDANIDLKVRMGGMAVLVPVGVQVNGAPVQGDDPQLRATDPEVSLPALSISVDQSMGEVVIERR